MVSTRVACVRAHTRDQCEWSPILRSILVLFPNTVISSSRIFLSVVPRSESACRASAVRNMVVQTVRDLRRSLRFPVLRINSSHFRATVLYETDPVPECSRRSLLLDPLNSFWAHMVSGIWLWTLRAHEDCCYLQERRGLLSLRSTFPRVQWCRVSSLIAWLQRCGDVLSPPCVLSVNYASSLPYVKTMCW